MMKYLATMAGSLLLVAAGGAYAQGATPSYKPTVDDWMGVNAAVDNYTLGLELHDSARFHKAFWPEAMIIVQPEPGKSFSMPYRQAEAGPPKPPPGAPMPPPGGLMPPPGAPMLPPGAPMPKGNAIGTDAEPWHLALSHHFEFQSPTRATHYGYFISVYPDLKTKMTTAGLPGHYDDILEQRNGEWRIIQRKTVIGAK
ncbi:MAG: hypothetical protein ACEQSK_06715 [Sphingomonadaceae bacterium]